eukprot:Plantae.Rhodophyta-Hildenbrandia_rubra.ctg3291.p1 GENE.Plantae.Rhodophyta-Hildenbrandia_rubra.ctg3291~~Plantae.Rhodophyta-Hildenbrandia_rubra.ctg3291.p1  ORF type:complete len:421 (-),score=126.63 Plantae.Rhodophyta-Hildenbrandia_rubra.ctg3291:867-2129(-)
MAQQGLFGPDLWDKLRANPETSALLADAEFKGILEDLQKNPSSLTQHISDPRVMKVFGVLAADANKTAPGMKKKQDAEEKAKEEEIVDESKMSEVERAELEKTRGNGMYKKRKFEEAIAHYDKAYELNGKNVAYLTNKAAALFEMGKYDEAIACCEEAIKKNGEESLRTDFKVIARAHARIGNAKGKLGDLGGCIEEYEKSLLEFHDGKVYERLVEARRLKKKKDEEAYLDEGISQKEREEGNRLFKEKKFPEAIKYYSEAIKRNPKDPAAYSNRAAAYTKLGEFPMALKDCDKCLEMDPKFMKAYVRKGKLHFGMKEYHKCIDVYNKGLGVDPNNTDMKKGLIETQMKISELQSNGGDDEVSKRAMQDPEIQQILQDPMLQQTLKNMESDPSYAAKAMRDPGIKAKVQKLMAAGILKVA